jgi:predicted  nucleic acid-binding Zn-ribbon protein
MELTVEQKLQALWDLQSIHTELDSIRSVRGELPMEVRDLEDDIAGLQTRIEKQKQDIEDTDRDIADKKVFIKDCLSLIKKYEEQQMKVKNSREFDAINKEMELQNLEAKVAEKKIREMEATIVGKKEALEVAVVDHDERKKDLEHKKGELETIVAETEKEEKKLLAEADKSCKNIEERLLNAYTRLREGSKNGLGVVTIARDSCAGCFNKIPPQRQADIRQRKKIIVCEHCGRILVDEIYAGTAEEVED